MGPTIADVERVKSRKSGPAMGAQTQAYAYPPSQFAAAGFGRQALAYRNPRGQF